MAELEIPFDHHPEVVENNKGIRRLELLGAKEIFADPHTRRDFFGKLADRQYAKILGYVESVTRGEPISYDYADGQAPHLSTPSLEDKAPLMQRTFETVRSILGQELLDDQTAMRRAALALSGAVNYIHPYQDGNGRTGRVMHYLVEFGAERGEQVFNDELYAIIAKLPLYDTHSGRALSDSPPPELTRALDTVARSRNPDQWASLDERAQASARVIAFLDMMRATVNVPINEDLRRRPRNPSSGEAHEPAVMPAGTLDGLTLYERDYLDRSAIPHFNPDAVPGGAKRVLARRQAGEPQKVWLSLDVLPDL